MNQTEAEVNLKSRVEYENTFVNVAGHTSIVGSPQDNFAEKTRSFGTNTSFEVDHLVSNQLKPDQNVESGVEYEDTIVNLVAQTSDGGSLQNNFAEETRNFKTNQLFEVGQQVSNQLKAEENA